MKLIAPCYCGACTSCRPEYKHPATCPRCSALSPAWERGNEDLCDDCDNQQIICNTCGKLEWPERITAGQCQYCYENEVEAI